MPIGLQLLIVAWQHTDHQTVFDACLDEKEIGTWTGKETMVSITLHGDGEVMVD